MSELSFVLVKLGVLTLLWLFVLAAVRAIRVDVFGPRVPKATRPAAVPQPKPQKQKQHKPQRAKRLVILEGAMAGQTIDLADAPITIGRSPESTLVLLDDYASTHHARLTPRDGQWVLEDLGSTNGTYLDRTKVSAPMQVAVGAKVRIGKTVMELRK